MDNGNSLEICKLVRESVLCFVSERIMSESPFRDQSIVSHIFMGHELLISQYEGSIGSKVWSSAIAFALWANLHGQECFREKKVLEVGAGCGLASLVTCACGANEILATDNDVLSLENLRLNVERNHDVLLRLRENLLGESSEEPNIRVEALDWNKFETTNEGTEEPSREQAPIENEFDVIIGTDVTYSEASGQIDFSGESEEGNGAETSELQESRVTYQVKQHGTKVARLIASLLKKHSESRGYIFSRADRGEDIAFFLSVLDTMGLSYQVEPIFSRSDTDIENRVSMNDSERESSRECAAQTKESECESVQTQEAHTHPMLRPFDCQHLAVLFIEVRWSPEQIEGIK